MNKQDDWSDISERIIAFSDDTLYAIRQQIDKEFAYRRQNVINRLKNRVSK